MEAMILQKVLRVGIADLSYLYMKFLYPLYARVWHSVANYVNTDMELGVKGLKKNSNFCLYGSRNNFKERIWSASKQTVLTIAFH